jgi:hypothetical protein
MQIKADERSFFDLFGGNNRFTVPDYQRNYAWKSEQIDAFLGDLFGLLKDPDEQHFFGPVVLLEGRDGELSLIDGQQRITTSVMLLCIIRDILQKDFDDDNLIIEGQQFSISTQFILQRLKINGFGADRYVANYQINDLFKTYVLAPVGSPQRKNFTPQGLGLSDLEKAATADLRRAYLRMEKFVREWLKPFAGDEQTMKELILELLLAMQNRFRILEIRMYSEDDAYILFETLNERGLRLTPSDLLKSFTLRKAREDNADNVDEILTRWDNTVALLGNFPFTTFLRHYLLSAQKDKVQARKIFAIFTELIRQYGRNGAARNLLEVEKAATVYSMLMGDNSTFADPATAKAVARINLFSDTHRVFLLRVMGTSFDVPAKRRAVRVTEILAFRWILTGGNAQELESLYQKAANIVRDGETASLKDATDLLITKLPSDGAVRSAITEGSARSELQNYVLHRLNLALTGVELQFVPQQVHVEHLAPQHPDATSNWFDRVAPRVAANPNDPTYEDYVSRWGNLTLLEFEINTSIGNSEWDIKKSGLPVNLFKGLQDSTIKMTVDVCDVNEWTAAAIDARTRWIADAMVAISSPSVVDGQLPTITSFTYTA